MFTPAHLSASSFRANGVVFDGTGDQATRAGLSGAVDGNKGILSAWLRPSSFNTTFNDIFGSTSFRVFFAYENTGGTPRLHLGLANSAGSVLARGVTSFDRYRVMQHQYWHFLSSWDLSVPVIHVVMNGYTDRASQTIATSGTVDYTVANWYLGHNASATRYAGALAELYFNIAAYLDVTDPVNLRKFRLPSGRPADLGDDGARPTGSAPIVYLSRRPGEAASAFFVNRGTGGDFTLTGTVDDAPVIGELRTPWVLQAFRSSNQFTNLAYSPSQGRVVGVSFGNGSAIYSDDGGENWTVVSPIPNLSNLFDVIWVEDLSLFLAGSNTAIYRSADGSSWTAGSTITSGAWDSIAWSSDLTLAVAVNTGGGVVTSPDGITWTARTPASAIAWNSVAWSPTLGLFCACAFSGAANGGLDRLMTSPDGINWTMRTAAVVAVWEQIEWSESAGVFVCVGRDAASGHALMTSPDGINWTQRSIPGGFTAPSFREIVWCGGIGKFVAMLFPNKVGTTTPDTGQTLVAMSEDGISWEMENAAAVSQWASVVDVPEMRRLVAISSVGFDSEGIPLMVMTREY